MTPMIRFFTSAIRKSAVMLALPCLMLSHFASAADGDDAPLARLNVSQTEYLVAEFTLGEPWRIAPRITTFDVSMERWKQLILMSQSDAIHLLHHPQIRELHDGAEMTDEMIDAQKIRMKERHANSDVKIKVEHVYLVLDPTTGSSHLIVPLHGEGGTHYTSYRRINGAWKITVAAKPDKTARQSKEIVDAHANLLDAKSSRHPILRLEELSRIHADSNQ